MFVQVQCAAWDKIFSVVDFPDGLKLYDKVILKTLAGLDLAAVVGLPAREPLAGEVEEGSAILRVATDDDLAKAAPTEDERGQTWQYAGEAIKRNGLDMKLVDVRRSWDDSRLTFAFVADGRVDFRNLVKEMSREFGRQIRLQQIGIRDEAKLLGDTGRCGRGLCCRTHLCKFNSVTSDMAEAQGISARGSDRISGACGRLMCCLAFEVEGYKYLAGTLPPVGAKVNVDGRRGEVVVQHLLKGAVSVKFKGEKGESDYVLEVDVKGRQEKNAKNNQKAKNR